VTHEYAYHAVHIAYGGEANPQAMARARAVRAYGRALELTEWCEVSGEGSIYGAPAPSVAAGAGD